MYFMENNEAETALCEMIKEGKRIEIEYVPTTENKADIFIKPNKLKFAQLQIKALLFRVHK